MKPNTPLVSIGIPTYNRAEMLRRSIESALGQDYQRIEVIISDNASTDTTQELCQEFSKKDGRIKYIRQSFNLGASANFAEVLKVASGEYFMWLGDDDWIDAFYISHCVALLRVDPNVALVSGYPRYYREGLKAYDGKLFDLLDKLWALRVARYYMAVADNGMFYGVMRTVQLQQIAMPNAMGGDWHLISNIVSAGKTRMSSVVSVHRELGGATVSYKKIAKSLGLSPIQAIFPMTAIAFGACKNIVFSGAAYKKRNILARVMLGAFVWLLVIFRPIKGYLGVARGCAGRTMRILKRYNLYK